MGYISREERAQSSVYLSRWVNTPGADKLTIKQYQRLTMWLYGQTFKQIAKEEGVTPQAISQGVGRDYKKLQAYILTLQ